MISYRDVSHYDYDRGDRGTDISGQPLLVAKATEGTDFTDPRYTYWRDQASTRGVPFAAYHYLRTSDTNAQARQAFSVVGRDIPLMLDVEANSGDVAKVLAVTKAYRALGGTVTLVYLPHWYWQQLGQPDLRPLTAAKLALVSSNYPSGGYANDGPGWEPYGGVTPSIWQYTATPHDLNAFRGTQKELLALVGVRNPPEQGPPSTEEIMQRLPLTKRGATGQHVRDVQGLINAHGGKLAVDGIFGPDTDSAVRKFQAKNHVADSVVDGHGDGKVGPYTWAALLDVA